ncbi:hypothetical protein [Janthinobacterium fluminis]|uniref:Uncharacterized protein n=1 Tax=Janthinobacterium fluminis TaxID=2987524 RepID=A0ABT5K6P2_9BURK|nr:hypothetical protein [Janthinobacterium fluminis]MDC8760667.1 hypothetical protein [Janthinobacterium fluminis]
MNDWPTPDIISLDAFMSELRQEIGELSRDNICKRLDSYSPVADAWKCESLSELLAAWDVSDEPFLLDDLVNRATTRF